MAHFARLNENNIVEQVIVVANKNTSDNNGVEDELTGIAFCKRLFGNNTNWKQTSYNNNMRVRYAGIGYTYDETLDAFIPPKPYESWVLNETTASWESPIGPAPELTQEQLNDETYTYYYFWVEETQTWQLNQVEKQPEQPA